ncbi:MAG: 30S ribosomal protein S20 [SAR324 cluster bacterium]|nr:30S ribosomal protein S20 [SAR324 cluster bacterium]
MIIHKSALKRARQNLKRNARNRALRTALRTVIKNYRALLAAKDFEGAQANLPGVHKAIDRAVTKGVLNKFTAARYKSRLTVALNKGQAA